MTRVGIGMRSLKTGLAVFICLALYAYIPSLTQPTLAVLVAVMAIQNNIEASVTFSKNRLVGTILGTIIGIIYMQLAGNSLILVAVGVIVLITLLNKLNQSQNIVIALVLFVNIITGVVNGNPIMYGINRFANTLVGITVGFIINYFVKPPNQIETIKLNVIEIVDEIEDIVKELIFTDNKINLEVFKKDLEEIEKNIDIYDTDQKYHLDLMDKINYVETSVINYNKLYNHIFMIKDKRATLNDENSKQAKVIFDENYRPQKNISTDETYTVVYNYHMSEIIQKMKKIKYDLDSVTSSKVIKQRFIKQSKLNKKIK